MKGNRVLAIEFLVLVGIASWGALKKKYYPWPPTIVKTALFVSLLGIVSVASEELAATLGAGFILANLIKLNSSGTTYMGGIPTDSAGVPTVPGHFPLSFQATKQDAKSGPKTNPVNPVNPTTPGQGSLGPSRPII